MSFAVEKEFPMTGYAGDLLAGKVVLVSGGGTGMGRACALQLAQCGAKVVLFARRREVLEHCAEEIAGLGREPALVTVGDIRDRETIQAAFDQINSVHGRLDVLVNNAGGQFMSAAKDIGFKGFETVIENNIFGTWNMSKLAFENFFQANGGKIICVTAVTRSGLAGFAHTACARGGVTALAKTLAAEWAEYGIKVNCVAPGTIKTAALGQYPVPAGTWDKFQRNLLGRMGQPEDVGNLIVYLASPLGDFITGEDWYVDGGETLHMAHDARQMMDEIMRLTRSRGDGLAIKRPKRKKAALKKSPKKTAKKAPAKKKAPARKAAKKAPAKKAPTRKAAKKASAKKAARR